MVVSPWFWADNSVFLTGHTGLKGSWVSTWLLHMGATVTAYASAPPTAPSLFDSAALSDRLNRTEGDIRDLERLTQSLQAAKPDIVIHMALQPLVRYSYDSPIETFSANVTGTLNLMEVVRKTPSVRAVINVTTDKCYDNKEWFCGGIASQRRSVGRIPTVAVKRARSW